MSHYVIKGRYTGQPAEEVDEFETRGEALAMLGEYRLSFGEGWALSVVRVRGAFEACQIAHFA